MMTLLDEVKQWAWQAALLLAVVPGVAHAAHPFVTDDTGTQGKGGWQFELTADQSRVKEDGVTSRNFEAGAALTYGVTGTLDLGVAVPYVRTKTDGEAAVRGVGDATIQGKWRFYENESGWSIALKPAITLPTGNEDRGLGAGRSTASLGVLAQYQKDAWAWMVNGGYTHNNNKVGERRNLWNASTAVLYSPNDQWTLGADVGVSRNPDVATSRALSYGLLGVQYHINKDLDVDVGYRRTLHSGPVEHTVGAGLTVRW